MDFDIFLAETLPIKMFYYATSSNLCFCTIWQNRKHKNCIFHSNAVL